MRNTTETEAVVYLVKITNHRGLYLFKYGHTTIGIPARFSREIAFSYDIEVLEETCYPSKSAARSAERDILNDVNRYAVSARFLISGGDTELLLTNPLTGEVSSNPPPGKVLDAMRRPQTAAAKQSGIAIPGRNMPMGVIANGRWC